MEVLIERDRIVLRPRISLVQIDIADPVGVERGPVDAGKLKVAIEKHGAYLLSHLRVSADGKEIEGKVQIVTAPAGEVKWEDFEDVFASYEIVYPLVTPPAKVRVEEDLLKEFSRLGQAWQVMFVVMSRTGDQREPTQSMLSSDQPVEISCDWSRSNGPAEAGPPLWVQYLRHGFMHILTGYDHLLFVAALVIGAGRLWDLVKVVTAFAVAHTLTLTLSVLNVVHVPSSIVEPMIAASIVFVAMQNVLFPGQSRGPSRLIVAFGFGLFHGLGFAGGLLEAMKGMPAVNLAVALAAFTIGVELAHQALIVPLYFLLKWIRTPGEVLLPMPLRMASFGISLAGIYYLVGALRS